jgi:hypothetical protein
MNTYHTFYPLLQGGSSKGIPWGRLKEIYLHYYTTMIQNASSKDVTAPNVPFLLSMSILVLIYYLCFAQGPSSR